MEVEPILPRHVRCAASRVRDGAVVGVVGEGTPALVDVDLLDLGAHLDALRATVAAAFDLVIGGERNNLAALRTAILASFDLVIRGERDNLRAGKDRPLRRKKNESGRCRHRKECVGRRQGRFNLGETLGIVW